MLKYLTAGESHGKCLVGILEGMPAGLKVDKRQIDAELTRRQKGYGRGARMKIEKDKVQIVSGLRKAKTIGSPIALLIENKDYKIDSLPSVVCPRPGHADLAGALKYNTKDIRDILERASARETAMRVAIGAICKMLLANFKIKISSKVLRIGKACTQAQMMTEIAKAKQAGDSLGGIFEIIATNLPAGLGSYVDWQRRLDTRVAQALMSIPAIKGVEIGAGFLGASQRGSEVHDAIFYTKSKGFFRKTNRAGGLEGGMSNGEPLVLRCAMKPIATLKNPLSSVNIRSKCPTEAGIERADVCAVSAAGVVGEAMLSFCLAESLLEKFGGDSLSETKRNHEGYLKQIKKF